MFLLHHFRTTKNLHVVHVNYNIRPDSDEDAKLVTRYCLEHGIPVHVKTISKPETSNVEAWAREVRYEFYRDILKQFNLKHIVTAHNANDQVETFYIRIHRGATLKGLACIYRDSSELYRPLLDWKKKDIYSECKRLEIPYREDSTNTDTKYLRNWYRKNMDTDQYTDVVGSICDKVQKILPKLYKLATIHFSDTVKMDGNVLLISKTLNPDSLLLLHLNNILGERFTITESVFQRMFSNDTSTKYFDIKRNIKCNKRKKNWIILEFT